MAFTTSQDELEGNAKGIAEEMDLVAESAPPPIWAPFLPTSPFLTRPLRTYGPRTAVLSGMTAAMSGSWASCLNMPAQTLFSSQRE
ncbi:MAG: hypothetical protein OXF50_11595 [Caldilineaceae bacterium]|nr:hypothetical protein [Caldilineaceae bacterium]